MSETISNYCYPCMVDLPSNEVFFLSREETITVAAEYFNVSVDEIKGKKRDRVLCNARHMLMKHFRETTDDSFYTIGILFGARDHTTVIHAVRVITDYMSVDDPLKSIYNGFKLFLNQKEKISFENNIKRGNA